MFFSKRGSCPLTVVLTGFVAGAAALWLGAAGALPRDTKTPIPSILTATTNRTPNFVIVLLLFDHVPRQHTAPVAFATSEQKRFWLTDGSGRLDREKRGDPGALSGRGGNLQLAVKTGNALLHAEKAKAAFTAARSQRASVKSHAVINDAASQSGALAFQLNHDVFGFGMTRHV